MSKLELYYFYLLEWEEDVVDIREGYPLTPVSDVMTHAEDLGVRYPVHPKTKQPIVMTEDFVVTVRRGITLTDHARAVKYEVDLTDRRTREKFAIQQRYWRGRGMDWRVVTEKVIPKVLVQNIQWIHPFRETSALWPLEQPDIHQAFVYMTNRIVDSSKTLADVAAGCDEHFGWEHGYGLSLARHFLANRYWTINMDQAIHPRRPLTVLSSLRGG